MKYMRSGEININSHSILNENKYKYEVTGSAVSGKQVKEFVNMNECANGCLCKS